MQLGGHLQQDAEVVAGAAAQGPEQVGVAVFVGAHDAAVGQHHQHVHHVVAVHAELARGEAIAAALHVAGHAHVAAAPRGHVQAVVGQGGVDMAPVASRPHHGHLARGVHVHAVEATGVDDHAVVQAETRRAVTTRARGDPQAVANRELQAFPDVLEHLAVHDQQRKALEGEIGQLPVCGVRAVTGQHRVALQTALQCPHLGGAKRVGITLGGSGPTPQALQARTFFATHAPHDVLLPGRRLPAFRKYECRGEPVPWGIRVSP